MQDREWGGGESPSPDRQRSFAFPFHSRFHFPEPTQCSSISFSVFSPQGCEELRMTSQSAILWQKLEYFSLMVSATAIPARAGTDCSALGCVECSRDPGRKLCLDSSQTANHRDQAGPSQGFQGLGQQQALQIAVVGSSRGVTLI